MSKWTTKKLFFLFFYAKYRSSSVFSSVAPWGLVQVPVHRTAASLFRPFLSLYSQPHVPQSILNWFDAPIDAPCCSPQFTGVILLAVGVWGKVSLEAFLSLASDESTNAPYVLIGTGAIIVIFGLFGCFATCRGSPWMLKLVSDDASPPFPPLHSPAMMPSCWSISNSCSTCGPS